MLGDIHLLEVGPTSHLDIDFAQRLNVLRGC